MLQAIVSGDDNCDLFHGRLDNEASGETCQKLDSGVLNLSSTLFIHSPVGIPPLGKEEIYKQ